MSENAITAQPRYIAGFDYLRIAAVFAVVWIHGSDTNAFAKSLQGLTAFAVPCFVLMSGYLTQRSALLRGDGLSFSALLSSRFSRLLPAYFVWSALYILARWVKHHFISGTATEFDWLLVILGGGASYQLWYVPALVLWTLIFGYLAIWLARRTLVNRMGVTLIVVGGVLIVVAKLVNNVLPIPDGYSLIIMSTMGYLGYFPLAMGLAFLFEGKSVRNVGWSVYGIALLLGFLAGVFYLWGSGLLNSLYIPAFSIALFLLGLGITKKVPSGVLRTLSVYAFGIYLCHAFFVEGLQMLLPRLGVDLAMLPGTLLVIFAAFILSAILCALLGRFNSTRWLVA